MPGRSMSVKVGSTGLTLPTTLLQVDLSGVSLGAITAAKAGTIWNQGGSLYADANWQNQTVVQDGGTNKRWWRFSTVAGASGEGSANGVSLGIPLASSVTEATYE